MEISLKDVTVTTRDIAEELGKGEAVVSNKIKKIFDKYGVKNEDKKCICLSLGMEEMEDIYLVIWMQ